MPALSLIGDAAITDPTAIADIKALVAGETDLAKIAEILRTQVRQVHGSGAKGDPNGLTPDYGAMTWQTSFHALVEEHQWRLPAEAMLVELREILQERQRVENQLFRTAVISQYLTESQVKRNSHQSAFRWALHTHSADILAAHGTTGGLGRVWLYGAFGVSDTERARLDSIALSCRTEALKGGWRVPAGFPEEVVRRLSIDVAGGSELFGRTLSTEEFPLSKPYLSTLIDSAAEPGLSPTEQGNRWEAIAAYLFGLLPGCIPRWNVKDIAGAAQHDLVVANHAAQGSLTSEAFGRYFLVECKNTVDAMNVAHVGYFLFRLRQAKASFGVLFSLSGITGDPKNEENARALIRRAFHEDGVTCIVIDKTAIQSLRDGSRRNLQSLLFSQLEQMRYGNPT